MKKAAWGNGYATESARAILQYEFKVLKLFVIYALIIPENTASIRVAQRLGMTPLGRTNQYYGGIELELFQLSVGVVPV